MGDPEGRKADWTLLLLLGDRTGLPYGRVWWDALSSSTTSRPSAPMLCPSSPDRDDTTLRLEKEPCRDMDGGDDAALAGLQLCGGGMRPAPPAAASVRETSARHCCC